MQNETAAGKDSNAQKKSGFAGIRMRAINYAMIAVFAVVFVLLLVAMFRLTQHYYTLQDETERYIQMENDASLLQQGSDYLTQQVRIFTVTGDADCLDQYFQEANVTRRRDIAIDDIRRLASGEESLAYLENAMSGSVELMQLEYRAMRLVLEAQGADLADMPEEIRSVELTAEELALSPEEKIQLAQSIAFGGEYQVQKDSINENVRACTATLTDSMRAQQMESSDALLRMIQHQRLLIALCMLIVLVIVLETSFLLIHPLERNIRRIHDAQPMEEAGSYESRFLAKSYNEMYSRMHANQDRLSYEVLHDPLTGVYNRKAFEKALAEHDEKDIALIIVDVDRFKQINDSYGHAAGDQVLQLVSSKLSEQFRSEDFVCRIGGDEFAVVMVHATTALRPLVLDKMARLKQTLLEQDKTEATITLSIGVAFGDRDGSHGSLFQDADTALYDVKRRGKSGCAVYEPGMARQE